MRRFRSDDYVCGGGVCPSWQGGSAARVPLFAFLTPLFDVLAGAALLHEQIAAPFVLPAALVATGSALVDRRA